MFIALLALKLVTKNGSLLFRPYVCVSKFGCKRWSRDLSCSLNLVRKDVFGGISGEGISVWKLEEGSMEVYEVFICLHE